MASASELYAALQSYHPNVALNTQGFLEDAQKAADQGIDANTFVSQYAADPRINDAYTKKATTFYQPTLSGYDTQKTTIGQQQQQTKLWYDQGVGATNNQFDYTKQNIQSNQYGQTDALMNAADAAGVTRTGANLQGVTNIAQDASRQLTYQESQRANTLAQLALQKAQQDTSLTGALSQVEAQKAQTMQQIGLDATQQSTQDTDAAFAKRLQLTQLGMTLPKGRELTVSPGYTVVGSYQMPSDAFDLLKSNIGLIGTSGWENLFSEALKSYGFNVNSEDLANLKQPSTNANSASVGTGSNVGAGGKLPDKPKTTNLTSVSSGNPASSYGVKDQTWSTASPYLSTYFKTGQWQGKDGEDIADIKNRFGVSGDQASAIYYLARKNAINQ